MLNLLEELEAFLSMLSPCFAWQMLQNILTQHFLSSFNPYFQIVTKTILL